MTNLAPKPGMTTSARRAELDAAPFARVRDLVTNVYKKPDGQPILGYVESLGTSHDMIKDMVVQYEAANGLLTVDGQGPAPAPTPVPQSAPPPTPVVQAAPPPTPIQAAPAAPAADAPRVSRRRAAQNGVAVAPPPAPAMPSSPVVSAPVVEAPTPPRTPVSSNGFTPPTIPANPGVATFTAPSFSPPVPVTAPVATPVPGASVDLGPVLQGLQSLGVGLETAVKNSDQALKKVTDVEAKLDHLMTALFYVFLTNPQLGSTLAQNKIDGVGKFKQYIQHLSNPQ